MGFQDRGYSSDRRPTFASEWTAVNAIIALNIAIWLANFILTGDLFRELFSLRLSLNDLLCLRSDLPTHPQNFWSLLSYGFLHDGPSLEQPNNQYSPMHLLFNMLTLWFFGRELEAVTGRGEFFRFYCAAIVFAGLAWVVGEGFGGQGGRLVGASGGVMAVLAAFIWYFPKQTVLVYGVLPVPVWALGILYLVSDVRGAAEGSGNVAHLAHLGGAVFGLMYAWRGWQFDWLASVPAGWLARRRRMRIVRPDDERPLSVRPGDDPRLDEEVDRILAKISRTGEGSLTAAERDTLTRASRRLKERSRP
ncbi:MAG: rhomboid family intramembrane serine protease [Pirellulales bacterium]|jgi:membrane associated rhomboid family serine protease